jgi:hypothetical protein
MKAMTSKYPGTCIKCRNRFDAGTEILWSKETGAQHAAPCTSINNTKEEFKAQNQERTIDDIHALVPGVYETNGIIYVVKSNREKTRLYAKKLVESYHNARLTESGSKADFEFEYDKGAIFNIRLEDRMPIDRAKELITLYGRCIACGRFLKQAKSVENGIGPVCIKNFGPVLIHDAETVDGRNIQIKKEAA